MTQRHKITLEFGAREVGVALASALVFGGGFAAVHAFVNGSGASNGLPVVLPYQGTLTESTAQGVAVTGPRAMAFRLFDADTGGGLLYESASQAVQVAGGKFSVVLGSDAWPGTAGNALDAADLRSPALWLELTMADPQGGAGIVFARQRIAPAPQAISATQASGDFTVFGNTMLGSGLTAKGNVVLGDAMTDTTTITGDVTISGSDVNTTSAPLLVKVGIQEMRLGGNELDVTTADLVFQSNSSHTTYFDNGLNVSSGDLEVSTGGVIKGQLRLEYYNCALGSTVSTVARCPNGKISRGIACTSGGECQVECCSVR